MATRKSTTTKNETKATMLPNGNTVDKAGLEAMKDFLKPTSGLVGVQMNGAMVGVPVAGDGDRSMDGAVSQEETNAEATGANTAEDEGQASAPVTEPDQGTNTTTDKMGEAWRDMVPESRKARLAELEELIKEQDALIAAGDAAEVDMQKTISSWRGTDRQKASLNNELKRQKNLTLKARDKRKTLQTALDKIKDAAVAKWHVRSEATEKALAKKASAQNKNALAKMDTFYHRPLTGEEKADRDRIEAEMTQRYDEMRGSGLRFADLLLEIKTKKLYADYAGGFNEYCQERWELDRSFIFRQIQASEQIAQLRHLIGQPVQYIDSAGNPVKVELNENELPKNEGQARALRAFGPGKGEEAHANQLKVWAQAVRQSRESGKDITAKIITQTGDDMVAKGEISIGLDAEIAKQTRERKQREGRVSPLNFNVYISRATWRGHTFDSYGLRDDKDLKLFECHVDGVPLKDPNGNNIRFSNPDSSVKFLEEHAKTLEPDMWSEDTTPPPPAEVTTPAANGQAPAEATNKPARRGGKEWYVGFDGDRPEAFDVEPGTVPDKEELGFDRIVGPLTNGKVGPFANKKAAEDYARKYVADKEKAATA